MVSHEVIVQFIRATTTRKGLKVLCEMDTNLYPKGLRVTDRELESVGIERGEFRGEWNYTIHPNPEP